MRNSYNSTVILLTAAMMIEAEAAEILIGNLYVTVATATTEGKPWNSPLYCAFDELLNYYWTSALDAQHSLNIRENRNVFLVVYDSTATLGTGKAIYFEATAEELSTPEAVALARTYTQARKGAQPDNPELFLGQSHRRVYQAVPLRAWINDAERDPNGTLVKDIRRELDLDRLRNQLSMKVKESK